MHTPIELAEAFIEAGELDDALEALNQQLEMHPEDMDARRLRIDVMIRLPGRAREALAELNALPDLTEWDYVKRMGALIQLGLSAEIEAPLIEAFKKYRHNSALEQLAMIVITLLEQRGKADQALEFLADLPKTPIWLMWSAKCYVLKGDNVTAAEHLCSALDQLANSTDPLLMLQRAGLTLQRADIYRRLKRYEDAEADYRAAEAIIPDDPMIPFNRGLMIYERGNLRGALPLCRDALDHAPEGLREHMRRVLTTDPRYNTLVQALLP
ncbi:MAG: tetratricopeptide repeat protein [Chloroflexi bacterium]|nr:tetratricopeptide repeat protein [Chloroflexota bacterium]